MMDINIDELTKGGAAVGMAWAMRELLPLIFKKRKEDDDDGKCYRPDESWKNYCMGKFEGISEALASLKINDEFLKDKMSRLELEVTKLAK